jgi:transcriptional/translational regulatory protein YebC/TACO1
MAEIQLVPENTVDLPEDKEESVQKLLDLLEENDDVQNVYHNAVL